MRFVTEHLKQRRQCVGRPWMVINEQHSQHERAKSTHFVTRSTKVHDRTTQFHFHSLASFRAITSCAASTIVLWHPVTATRTAGCSSSARASARTRILYFYAS